MTVSDRPAGFDFLAGDSEMAQRMRAFDWHTNPLGTPAGWPAALRTMVRMALLTRHPVFIFWGAQHLCLYNDAYSASIGPEKHPGILGQPGRQAWPEIWHIIEPQIKQVLRGDGATWHENQLVPIIRHGGLQDAYWTYSYAPVHDETAANGVGGVLVLCTETTEQVLAKQHLSVEHRRMTSLFAQAPAFMALLSGPDHVFELVNPAYRRIIGGRDVVGRALAEVLPETVGQGYVRLLDDVYASGRPYVASSARYDSPDPDEGPRFLDFVYQPVTDESGNVSGIFVVGSDVTDRNLAVQALARSEEQLRLATEAAEVGLWDVDPVHDTLYWTSPLRAMFGISTDRALSLRDFYTGLHPDDRPAVMAAFADAMDARQRALYDVEYRTVGHDDGIVRWVAAKGRGIFEGKRCVRVVGTALDITTRKRDEQRIRELHETLEKRVAEYLAERKLFADVVEGTDAFVQVADLNFNWLAINRASMDEFERIFGQRPAVGKNMLQLLADMPEHQAAVRRIWQRALSGEDFTEVQEFGEESLDRRCYEMHFRTLRDTDGRCVGAYQFVYDVTARLLGERRLAEAEAALSQAQKMEAVGQLTGGLAHDFNNLLQAVSFNFELLRRKPDDPALTMRLAERGLDITRRAARLTTQLLTFSRQQSLVIRPVGVQALVSGMEEILKSTVGSQVTLSIAPIDEDLWVSVDSTQLEMAILNLCINARDAMPAGGEVVVSAVRADDTTVDICVKDNGLGMSKEVAAKAFDPFFTTKDLGKGSGLGLSQVYAMATRAQGTARIQSAPGQGTSVVITLQWARPVPAQDLGGVLGEPGHASLTGAILVVDDDAEVRSGLVASLRSLGHHVLEAAGGEEGLDALQRSGVDVMLVDYAMPGMNGAQVAQLARALRPALGIVFMSGYSDMDAIAAAVGQDAVLLRKPFVLATVHEALQRALRQRREAPADAGATATP